MWNNKIYQNTTFISDLFTNICLLLCPLESNETLFKSSVSTTLLVGDKYLSRIQNSKLATDLINRTIDVTRVKMSLVKVNISRWESFLYRDNWITSYEHGLIAWFGSIFGYERS